MRTLYAVLPCTCVIEHCAMAGTYAGAHVGFEQVIALFENSRKSWEQRDGDMGVLVMDDLSESMNQILSVLSGP